MRLKKHIIKIYNRIMSSHFLKSVLTLSSGVVIAQAINFICTPIIGRLYTPAEIGDYTLITSNATVIGAFVCLGMMTALIIPETDKESRSLCKLVSFWTLILTTLVIIVLFFSSPVYKIFELEGITYNIGLITLWTYVIFNTLYNICYAYVNRLKMYKVMFWNPIIGAGINMGVSIALGFTGIGFIGYAVANILSFIFNVIHLVRHANPFVREQISANSYKQLTLKYRRFPLFQMPANLIANVGVQMPVWTIKAIYGAGALGMYSMTMRILALPSTLLATPINRVYFQEASQKYNKGEDIGEFSFKILEANIKIAIIPIMIIVIFGQQLFSLFLGAEWAEAGAYASILGIYQLILFCNSCLSGDFVIINKNSWNLISAIATLIIQAILYIVFLKFIDVSVYTFLMTFSIVMILKNVIAQTFFFKYLNFSLKKYYLFILKFIGIPMIATYGVFQILVYRGL